MTDPPELRPGEWSDELLYEPEDSPVAALSRLVEMGWMDVGSAVEIAVREIARVPVRDHFSEIDGEVGRQLRLITYFAIHEPTRRGLESWLQTEDAWIQEGIKKLIACANKFGCATDDLGV